MITLIYGKTYPTTDPATLGTTYAQLATAGLLEVMITLGNTVDGEVNIWVLGYDAECGWQPLAQLVCNKRDAPRLAGRNGFRDIEIPTQRYVCLYAPEIAAVDVVDACITSYLPVATVSGGSGDGIAGLYIPDVPPSSPSADDDEFNGATLDPRWNLHTVGFSANPVVWTADTIDEGTIETGHVVRYQLGAPGNPSAFVVQPGADVTDSAGMSRKLASGVTPTNWIMRAGFSCGTQRENGVAPDITMYMFMANDDPGNGHGDWDWLNFACLYVQSTSLGMIVGGASIMGVGTFATFANGAAMTLPIGVQPCQFILKKTGNLYRASVRMSNGQKIVLMNDTLALSPVRFGLTFQAASQPNAIIPVNYIRHEFSARGF